MKLLFFILFLGLSNAARVSDNPCPDRPTFPSIDVEKLKGKWYGVQVYPNYHERTLNCLHYTVAPTGLFEYDFTFCEKTNGVHLCNDAKWKHTEKDGKFIFNLGKREFDLFLNKGRSTGIKAWNYNFFKSFPWQILISI